MPSFMVTERGCAPPMPPSPAVSTSFPFEGRPAAFFGQREEGLISALQDALGADIDPRTGGHLAVHHQSTGGKVVEVLLGGPVRHQVGVGDEHARGVRVGFENGYGFAGLHQQGLVVLEVHAGSPGWRRTLPNCGQPCRVHRKPPVPAAFRPLQGQGCSGSCGKRLRSARTCR